MCTASWSAGQGRLSLCFNRDELKTRTEARPPEVLDLGGVRAIAGIDPDGGGTWLALNERGLCVFLLNNYAAQGDSVPPPRRARSRGELPLRYAACARRAEAVAKLATDGLTAYPPFLLGVADAEGAQVFAWDGETLAARPLEEFFLTTSSFRTAEVEAYRNYYYKELLEQELSLAAERRRRLHVDVPHADPAFNPMMLRVESRTRSVSTVEVGPTAVVYRYEAVEGDSRRLGEEREIKINRKQDLGTGSSVK